MLQSFRGTFAQRLVSERSDRNVIDSRKKLQLSPLIKHTNSANCNDGGAISDPVSSRRHHEARVHTGFFTASPEWHHFLCWYLHAARQTAKQLGGDVGGCTFVGFESSLNLVWIWFVWTQSERLHGGPTGIWSANWWGRGIPRGRGRSLGSIGNMKKQFSLYYIYLFKVISIQHKHTFSPHIMYFNMNNSYQHHHLIQKFLFVSVV